MSDCFAAVCVVALVLGCSQRMTRDGIRDGYRRALVNAGVHAAQAKCLTDHFFASLSDDQLRAFQGRDRLTDAERDEFGKLADICGDPGATLP